MEPLRRTDVLICGAGSAGLALAVALKVTLGEALQVAVLAPALPRAPASGRASALAAGPVRMLRALGVWGGLEPKAQPVRRMIITDSRRSDPVRPVFLNFESEVAPGEPFAWMLYNDDLQAALRARAEEAGVVFLTGAVTGLTQGLACAEVSTGDARLGANLVVAADGAQSRLRTLAGIRTIGWPYRVSGIVATIGHERDHEGCAREHFLPGGPFALLPLKGRRSSIVWTESEARAADLISLPDDFFLDEVEQRLGREFGRLTLEDRPSAHPLRLQIASKYTGERLCLIGDAAHVVHPIAGQGLNLGLRDVGQLAELIVEEARLGADIGNPDVLARYQQSRRFDSFVMGAATDILHRLFAEDADVVRRVRDIGLGLVDRAPRLKSYFVKEAAGLAGSVPRLLAGEAL